MKAKIAILISLAVIATIIDWFVVHAGFATGGYIIGGWTIVGFVCLRLFYPIRFRVVMAFVWRAFKVCVTIAVIVAGIAMVEDFLFLCACTVFKGRPFYPLYCHDWMPDVIGKWATPMSYDWFGIPSAYYISVLAIVFILFIKSLTFTSRCDTVKSNGGNDES